MMAPRFLSLLLMGCAVVAAQSSMICQRPDSPPATIRAEGAAEMLADVVITCTGGTPTAAGAAVPAYQILVIGSAPLSLRLARIPTVDPAKILDAPVQNTIQWTEALALVDEPSPSDQRPCVPAPPADSCPASAGAADRPNVFQGSLIQDNVLVFSKIPIDPPGPGKIRTIRITNLRASAARIPKLPDPDRITLTVQLFDRNGHQLSVSGAAQVAAITKASYTVSLRTADGAEVNPATPALTVTPAMLPQNNPGAAQGFLIRFSEAFPSAFKRRNLGTTGFDPNFLVSQADPGAVSNTESGFYNSAFPIDNDLNSAGLADSGTRFKVVLTGIPDNVFVWASARDVALGTTNYSGATPRALLTYTTASGGGPFSQNHPENGTFALVYTDNGSATLVWEVVAADASVREDITFEIRLLAPNGVARVGTGMIHATLGPTVASANSTSSDLPSFIDSAADPVPAFRIVPTLAVGSLTSMSAASYSSAAVAPDSIVATFGSKLSAVTATSGTAPVSTISGVRVEVIDNSGTRRTAPLFLVSPGQINFLMNAGTSAGLAVVTVFNGDQNVATGTIRVVSVAPGLFSAAGTGTGPAIGQAVTVVGSQTRTSNLANFDTASQTWKAVPLDLSGDTATFLTLYGTGIRGRTSLQTVTLKADDQNIPVTFAGPQGGAGLDEIDAGPLPRSLAGKGDVRLTLTVDGKTANVVTISVK